MFQGIFVYEKLFKEINKRRWERLLHRRKIKLIRMWDNKLTTSLSVFKNDKKKENSTEYVSVSKHVLFQKINLTRRFITSYVRPRAKSIPIIDV